MVTLCIATQYIGWPKLRKRGQRGFAPDPRDARLDGDNVIAGANALSGASVTGKIIGITKGPKINGFTYKRRTNNRRRYGHRQKYTMVEITSIKKS